MPRDLSACAASLSPGVVAYATAAAASDIVGMDAAIAAATTTAAIAAAATNATNAAAIAAIAAAANNAAMAAAAPTNAAVPAAAAVAFAAAAAAAVAAAAHLALRVAERVRRRPRCSGLALAAAAALPPKDLAPPLLASLARVCGVATPGLLASLPTSTVDLITPHVAAQCTPALLSCWSDPYQRNPLNMSRLLMYRYELSPDVGGIASHRRAPAPQKSAVRVCCLPGLMSRCSSLLGICRTCTRRT